MPSGNLHFNKKASDLCTLLLLVMFLDGTEAFGRSDCNVKINCSTHVITVLGKTSRIDCGKPGHVSYNGVGRIGGYHKGKIVKNGIRIEGIRGMGDSGGGKVIHSVSWGPKGLNDSKGCIHVTPTTRDTLHQCQGSRLVITGATSRAAPPPGTHPRHHRQNKHHRLNSNAGSAN